MSNSQMKSLKSFLSKNHAANKDPSVKSQIEAAVAASTKTSPPRQEYDYPGND